MCGIAGFCGYTGESKSILSRMLGRLAHRGPDDSGVWLDRKSGVVLGHRRLSVVDLSPAGHQPMVSETGRFVLTYNGEIYNHTELRNQLERAGEPTAWRGHSDTEVLLAAFEAWGINETLVRCNGMFALALWDNAHHSLILARDRMGEKPLYFGWVGAQFAFASELKAFSALPGWSPKMNRSAVTSFLYSGYVHGLESAVAGVFRLPAGCYIRLTTEQMQRQQSRDWIIANSNAYWQLSEVVTRAAERRITDPQEAANKLDSLLREAVALRMLADVPLGAFLSGGLDSSVITALMQAQSSSPIHTFSIGFTESGYDEAPFARAIANHLGTDHSELYVDAEAALELVPALAEIFDEPFADSSQLPTLLIAEIARKHVTVALTGDGADELFAGYPRYLAMRHHLRLFGRLPWTIRRTASAACSTAATLLSMVLRDDVRYGLFPGRLERLAERLATTDYDAMRTTFIAGTGRTKLVLDAAAKGVAGSVPPPLRDILRKLMYCDQADYLTDDILFKVDRASMSHGLEIRTPFLDHRVVELSWRLATSVLEDGHQGKQPIRRVLERYVPRSLFDRSKQGFSPPIDAWLRGPLRDWAESKLTLRAIGELPMLDPQRVRKVWNHHCLGKINAGNVLWGVLMLSDWCRRFGVTY